MLTRKTALLTGLGIWLTASPVAFAGGDPLLVCIGERGALRLIEQDDKCDQGEAQKIFAEWEPEVEEGPDPEDDSVAKLAARIDDLEIRIASLEDTSGENAQPDRTERLSVDKLSERVSALENGRPKSGSRVTAPFEVVADDGTIILRVAKTISRASGDGAQVTIGAGPSSGYGVRVYSGGDQMVAGIVHAGQGGGVVGVMNSKGELTANLDGERRGVSVFNGPNATAGMVAEDRGGTLAVYNEGKAIAYLTRNSMGTGGNMTALTDSGGQAFSAGAIANGAGEACVERITSDGTRRGACLGISLPGGLSQ